MICTETEAKEKWCPQARMDTTGANRTQLSDVSNAPVCVGSACMMWVWEYAEGATIRVWYNPDDSSEFDRLIADGWRVKSNIERDYTLERKGERRGTCSLINGGKS